MHYFIIHKEMIQSNSHQRRPNLQVEGLYRVNMLIPPEHIHRNFANQLHEIKRGASRQ